MIHGGRWLIGALMIGVLAGASPPSAPGATPDQVENAIQKAKAFLYAHQSHGTWDPPHAGKQKHSQWGGMTAIATYALLAAGESRQEPRLQKAIEFLKTADIEGIYALGLRAQMWHYLPLRPEIKPFIKRDGDLLLQSMKTEGAPRGMFNYPVKDGPAGRYDHSVSQYGVLGLWAVAQCGYEVPTAAWELMDHAWREHQDQEGGWEYIHKDKGDARASMTAAGVATLFITQDYLNMGKSAECTGNKIDQSIERGLKWMETHFKSVTGARSYYTLYGIERIGVASGRKYFGTIDWYDDGAEYLVRHQVASGGWGSVPDTCFAVLFLCRGRAPVVMNKLQYDIDVHGDKPKVANWNERPRDCANLVRWMGQQLERDLNWQVVNLRVPIDDLHDAPILYIAGNQNLVFSAAEEKKLKLFIEQGGMILANADCQSLIFTQAIEKLGQKLFPDYEFRDLPRDHIVFRQPFSSEKWKIVPKVRAMTNGARELIVLLPTADYSRLWQMGVYGGQEAGHQLLWNLYLYSVDKKGLRNKGETYIVHANSGVKDSKSVKVARLEYEGNWNPEPGGWRRLSALMHNRNQVDLDTVRVKPGSGKLTSDQTRVAHLTGTHKFKLNEQARQEIKKFVEGGGTLIVDACGGSSDFAASAEDQLGEIFGAKPHLVDLNHAVFATGGSAKEVSYRGYAKKIVGNTNSPRLKAIEVNNRTAVFFSAEDLSTGLVGQPVDGIYGYEPASATDLMRNMLLYATGGGASVAKADPPKADPPKADTPKADPSKTDKPKPGGRKNKDKPANKK